MTTKYPLTIEGSSQYDYNSFFLLGCIKSRLNMPVMPQSLKLHSILQRWFIQRRFPSSPAITSSLLPQVWHSSSFFSTFLRLIKYLLFLSPGLFIIGSVFSAEAQQCRLTLPSVWLSVAGGWRLGRVRGSEHAGNVGRSHFAGTNWACEPHTLQSFSHRAHTG